MANDDPDVVWVSGEVPGHIVSEFDNITGMATLLSTGSSRLIEDALGSSGFSQAELARRAGIPRSVLNAYLRGARQPGGDALMRIAAAAGLELGLSPRAAPVNQQRAGRILVQVLELAEALPFSRGEDLEYPPLPGATTTNSDK